jgi:hypothetical protein
MFDMQIRYGEVRGFEEGMPARLGRDGIVRWWGSYLYRNVVSFSASRVSQLPNDWKPKL